MDYCYDVKLIIKNRRTDKDLSKETTVDRETAEKLVNDFNKLTHMLVSIPLSDID